MKDSLVLIGFFAAGIILSLKFDLPLWLLDKDITHYALYILLFAVGLTLGCDSHIRTLFIQIKLKYIIIPFLCVAGALAGGGLFSILQNSIPIKDSLAISFGFGYYSLSSIMISEFSGESMGVIALISNIFREIFTLVFAPLLIKYMGDFAAMVSGGATSMDTTLAVTVKYAGKKYAIISIFNGIVLTLLVPLLISFIYGLK